VGDNPEEFVSHLPVPLDGSCNGLQHLAAMGRDVVGAQATNIVPAEVPRSGATVQ
jgi:DNA-directed RNA polymerase